VTKRPHHPATEERAFALRVVKPKPCRAMRVSFGLTRAIDASHFDESGHVSGERGSSSDERDGEEDVRPDARAGEGGKNLGDGDLLARLGLVGVIVDDPSGEDVTLAFGKVGKVEEERSRAEGRRGEEEDE
jgi:hypothetical protein